MDGSTHFCLGSVLERLFVLISTTHKIFLFLSTLCCTFIIFLFAPEMCTHQCMLRCQSCSVIYNLFCSLSLELSLLISPVNLTFRMSSCDDYPEIMNAACICMYFHLNIKKVLTFKKRHISHRLLNINKLIKETLISQCFIQMVFICKSWFLRRV